MGHNLVSVRCFFQHSTDIFPYGTPKWWEPISAGIGMINPPEKQPAWYQKYVPVTKVRVSHVLGRGREATITLETSSNRELFDYQDNEGLLWYKEPYREWEISMKSWRDSTPAVVFRGFPVDGSNEALNDEPIPGERDGFWSNTIKLTGMDHCLQRNSGLHQPRTINAYGWNQVMELLVDELNSRGIPLAHSSYSYPSTPEHMKEPFEDWGDIEVAPELTITEDSTTWDLLRKIADELTKYSVSSEGQPGQIDQGDTYAPVVDFDLNIDFIPTNFKQGQKPAEYFRDVGMTYFGGTLSTRILGEGAGKYGKIGQTFSTDMELDTIRISADPGIIPNESLLNFNLYESKGGPLIHQETIHVYPVPEDEYSFSFPTQMPGSYYFEIESLVGSNNIAFRAWEGSGYAGGQLNLYDTTWTTPAGVDLDAEVLTPPWIKLSPIITKEHDKTITSAVVVGLCETCVDREAEEVSILDTSQADGTTTLAAAAGSSIGQLFYTGLPAVPVNTVQIPARNLSAARSMVKLTLYDSAARAIKLGETYCPLPAGAELAWLELPLGVYSNWGTRYYWEITPVSGLVAVYHKLGTSDHQAYQNGAQLTDRYFATDYIKGGACVGWARYPELMLRDSANPDSYERPEPEAYGIRGQSHIQVNWNSDWVKKYARNITRCRNLAREFVFKNNYPPYSAAFTVQGGYTRDIVGKYVLLYNYYENSVQNFLVTEQTHNYEKGWNSMTTSFTAVRTGNKP